MKGKATIIWRTALIVLPLLICGSIVRGQEAGVDRPGKDYKNFDLQSADPELCKKACQDDPNCKAYTYVKPGVQGASARCWLKSDVPAAAANECCISGVKDQAVLAETVNTVSRVKSKTTGVKDYEKPKPTVGGQSPKGQSGQGPTPGKARESGTIPGNPSGPTIGGQQGQSPFGKGVDPSVAGGKSSADQLGKYDPGSKGKLQEQPSKIDLNSAEWRSKAGGLGPGKWAEGETLTTELALMDYSVAAEDATNGNNNGASYYHDNDCTVVQVENLDDTTTTRFYKEGEGAVVELKVNPDGSGVSKAKQNDGNWGVGKYYGPGTFPQGGGNKDELEGTDVKFDPKTIDPQLREQLARYLPKRRVDPRLGWVGDPAVQLSAISSVAKDKGMAGPAGGGGGRIEATWVFGARKPGSELIGPPRVDKGTDPDAIKHPEINPKDTLPDPMERSAIKATSRSSAIAGEAMQVTLVSGRVEKLIGRDDQSRWSPLVPGDAIASGTIIRITNETGAAIKATGKLERMLAPVRWQKIYEDRLHSLRSLHDK